MAFIKFVLMIYVGYTCKWMFLNIFYIIKLGVFYAFYNQKSNKYSKNNNLDILVFTRL